MLHAPSQFVLVARCASMSAAAIRTGADRTLELLARQIGRPLSEVETPVAVVDLDRLDANLRDLQSYADAHGIALWPHTKTHKSPEIGLRQLELGAGGLTVAKTGEAEVFQEAGAPKILVHYPPFGTDKWERLARHCRRCRADGGGGQRRSRRGSRGRAGAPRGSCDPARRAGRRSPPNRPDHRGRSARGGAGALPSYRR